MRVVNTTLVILLSLTLIHSGTSSAEEQDKTQPLLIKTPTRCEIFEKFEPPNRVVLTTPDICPEHNGFVQAPVPYGLDRVDIYANGQKVGEQDVLSFGTKPYDQVSVDTKAMENQLKDQGFSIEETTDQDNPAVKEAIDLSSRIYSKEYQARIEAERNRIQAEIFPEQAKILDEHLEQKQDNEEARGIQRILAEDERIYLFVSKSIPNDIVRQYMKSFDKVRDPNVVLVMRGFVNGANKIRPTLDYLLGIRTKDTGCIPKPDSDPCDAYGVDVIIDPLLFKRYNVTQVPTLVYVQGVSFINGMTGGTEGSEEKVTTGDAWSIEGDASPQYMLEKINTEVNSPTLTAYIKAMNKGFY